MPATSAQADVPLQTLLDRVIQARSSLAVARHANLGAAAMDDARAQMVTSLEAYTWALQSLHLPVPYALRDELRTQRSAYRIGTGHDVRARSDPATPTWDDRGRWPGFRDDTT